MRLSIGENIKRLRRERDITQEQLAEIFNVSCQTISRWETDSSYPDIEMLPVIADFFNTTVDKLMGTDEMLVRNKVDKYLSDYKLAISRGDVYECISIAREGVKEFPNNYELLNKLMDALFISGDSDGGLSEWKENMQKYDAEITELGERIMKYCTDQDIRLEATIRLAFNHCEQGRKNEGRRIYEKKLLSAKHLTEMIKKDDVIYALAKQYNAENVLKNTIQRLKSTKFPAIVRLRKSKRFIDLLENFEIK